MVTNIVLGKNSFVTKSLLKFIDKSEVYSANDLNEISLKKIKSKKKINLIFFTKLF